MKRNFLLLLLFLCTVSRASAQQMTQTIRGIVVDKDSKSPLAFVNVVLDKSNPTVGAISDTNGVFILSKIPVGRQSLNVSFVGYKPQTLSDIQINVAKEIVLTIELEENTTAFGDQQKLGFYAQQSSYGGVRCEFYKGFSFESGNVLPIFVEYSR